jgi:hypothetical protein
VCVPAAKGRARTWERSTGRAAAAAISSFAEASPRSRATATACDTGGERERRFGGLSRRSFPCRIALSRLKLRRPPRPTGPRAPRPSRSSRSLRLSASLRLAGLIERRPPLGLRLRLRLLLPPLRLRLLLRLLLRLRLRLCGERERLVRGASSGFLAASLSAGAAAGSPASAIFCWHPKHHHGR